MAQSQDPTRSHARTQRDDRQCAECGIPVRPDDGGLIAFGQRFCSEDCIDEYEMGHA